MFGERAAAATSGGGKQDRVMRYVREQAPSTFRISDVRSALPGVSDGTIRLALERLRQLGGVEVDGLGRNATWTRR